MPVKRLQRSLLLAGVIATGTGGSSCSRYASVPEASSSGSRHAEEIASEHDHRPGASGGVISSLGRDEYHTEAVIEEGGVLALYTFGPDETRIEEVPQQVLTAYLQPHDSREALIMVLKPDPLESDSESMTSRFRGPLPKDLIGQRFRATVPGLRIAGARFAVRFESLSPASQPAMPEPRAGDEAEELYLTAGGLYTEADIAANGRTTAAERYTRFLANHNLNPLPGERICPITQTAANPECSWVIGGKAYQFCCPPCIDEFLARAKRQPAEVRAPEDYVHQE